MTTIIEKKPIIREDGLYYEVPKVLGRVAVSAATITTVALACLVGVGIVSTAGLSVSLALTTGLLVTLSLGVITTAISTTLFFRKIFANSHESNNQAKLKIPQQPLQFSTPRKKNSADLIDGLKPLAIQRVSSSNDGLSVKTRDGKYLRLGDRWLTIEPNGKDIKTKKVLEKYLPFLYNTGTAKKWPFKCLMAESLAIKNGDSKNMQLVVPQLSGVSRKHIKKLKSILSVTPSNYGRALEKAPLIKKEEMLVMAVFLTLIFWEKCAREIQATSTLLLGALDLFYMSPKKG